MSIITTMAIILNMRRSTGITIMIMTMSTSIIMIMSTNAIIIMRPWRILKDSSTGWTCPTR